MLNGHWRNEEGSEKDLEKEKKVLDRERLLEIIKHNEQEKNLRDGQYYAERKRDKEMIESMLFHEKRLMEIE
jgi:hypothetical protein